MTNEDFIKQHRNENPLSLALKKTPDGVDLQWCLRQIEGYNIAKKKLPEWAEKTISGILQNFLWNNVPAKQQQSISRL